MRQTIQELVSQTIADVFQQEIDVELTRPDPQFGDFATNVALQLAKPLGKNPREIAESIAQRIRENTYIDSVSVAGPGFLNITVTDRALIEMAGSQPIAVRQHSKVVIETNNPNPFKAMHIGHAYNAIVADTLANLLDAGGAEAHRVSYHGDVGAHVGKSMYSILRWLDGNLSKLDSISPEDRNTFMSEHYANGARAYKEDNEAKAEIDQLAQQSFTLDDQLYRQVYETCKAWSFEELDKIVAKLGNQPVEKRYLESQADAIGVEKVKQHIGDVFEESDGAIIFPGEKHGSFTNVFVSSSGRGLYAARDLGLMELKQADFQPDRSIIVTGGEQREYFKGVIKAAELVDAALEGVTTNIPTGLVKLSTGKMSSRTGEVLDIAWLFEQIESAIKEQGNTHPDTLVGAIRYEFLKVRVGGDVVFDVGESVSIKGNSGPYLQYAHARARSILRKAHTDGDWAGELEKGERDLVRKLGHYGDVTTRAVEELMPHHLCTYLYELAQSFNRFYEDNKVIGHEREQLRLALVRQYADTLKAGLSILGITAPEEM